jgi:uncharacterized protein YkwD
MPGSERSTGNIGGKMKKNFLQDLKGTAKKSAWLLIFPLTLFFHGSHVAYGADKEATTNNVYFQSGQPILLYQKDETAAEFRTIAYPPDPTSDIPWSAGMSSVSDIQTAFNSARTEENTQIGTSIPMLTMPSQSTWDGMTDNEKALWLVNRERIDRGVHPLHGTETNVIEVAQYYAQYLIDHDAFSHNADGHTPWERLNTKPAINNCHDFLNIAENLAVFWTSGSSIPLPVERAIYNWMYKDSSSSWGHRHAILWYNYNDNSGIPGMEGFMGLGRASGPHQGWNFAEMIVLNFFDPCATWNYAEESSKVIPAINELLLLDSN